MSKSVTLKAPAHLTAQERSGYFRGLLLIMAADGKLDTDEIERIKILGKELDFESGFVDESILNVLQNEYVSRLPPVFESPATAQFFLTSAISIAFADGVLVNRELQWLENAAGVNHLPLKWLHEQIDAARAGLQAQQEEPASAN